MPVEPASNNGVEKHTREAGKQIMEPEVASAGPSGRNADFSVHLSSIPVVFCSSGSGKVLNQSPRCLSGNSSPGRFLQSLSFKNKAVLVDGEGSSLLNPEAKEVPGSPVLASIISSWKKCVSLPVTQASTSAEDISGKPQTSLKTADLSKVPRSVSAPVRNVVIVRSRSFAIRKESVQTVTGDSTYVCADQINHVDMGDDDQEIPEEKAVCRICFDSLDEGGNTFKLECSCKGDLELTHEACVLKWFGLKGDKKCEVCGQEVRNLPVTVLRVQAAAQRDNERVQSRQQNPQPLSVWHDFVVLILISSISYFFIIEQLLIPDMKTQATMIAAPFSFTLGLLGSMFSIILATKEYIWTYTALEFALVALNLQIFYALLHLNAVYAILLSTVLGFGVALSIHSVYRYISAYQSRVAQAHIDSDPV